MAILSESKKRGMVISEDLDSFTKEFTEVASKKSPSEEERRIRLVKKLGTLRDEDYHKLIKLL